VSAIRATNRTQRLVLAFFAFVWLAFAMILVAAPQIYDATLTLGPGDHRLADMAFLTLLSALIATLVVGVIRRWRWLFWLIVVAFLFGIVRVIASGLQLANVLPSTGPRWYSVLQGVIGVLQFLIALAMISGCRRGGVWGEF
jgi:hypothetical protein